MGSRTLSIAFLLLWLHSAAQSLPDRNWHARIPMELNIGANLADLDGEGFGQVLGSVIVLQSGVSLTRKENWGLSILGGGLLDSYTYSKEDVSYTVGLLSSRTEARIFKLLPLSEVHESHLKFSIGYGWVFYADDEERELEPTFRAISNSFDRTTAQIIPEFGVSKRFGPHRVDLAIRYQASIQASGPALRTELSGTDGSFSTATASGDFLGLSIRYHHGFPERQLIPLRPPNPGTMERQLDEVFIGSTHKRSVKLILWDNAETDGDSLDIALNGQFIHTDIALSKEKVRLKIPLTPGPNELVIIAKNEGRVSPNTASCLLKTGKRRERLLLSTSLEENDVLRIVRD